MDDEGDFKKARGFLLTYSALVLALLYFGADLTQFKLMGNEVRLLHRADSAWLVLAAVNIYFWFRYFQRLPTSGLYFDEPMNDLYDKTLVWAAWKLKRRDLNIDAQRHFAENYDNKLKMRLDHPTVEATARRTIEVDKIQHGEDATELQYLSREERTSVTLHATYAVFKDDAWKPYAGYGRVTYKPGARLTWTLKAFTTVRGAFITPWFTDYIAPLVLGGISIGAAFWKWCDVTFLAARLSHASLLCV